ncbi:MAG TPA: hypothetical protein PLF26_09160 [Blastocatellia bacterium]|nr:hypothetical protein [Blastocatellia bacterium]
MTSAQNSPVRLAPDAPSELAEFVECVESVHRDHTVSYVLAGNDKIYAYGANGYTVVLSDAVFGALVEVDTPGGELRVEPDSDGVVGVKPVAEGGEQSVGALLAATTRELKSYYTRRYWKV